MAWGRFGKELYHTSFSFLCPEKDRQSTHSSSLCWKFAESEEINSVYYGLLFILQVLDLVAAVVSQTQNSKIFHVLRSSSFNYKVKANRLLQRRT